MEVKKCGLAAFKLSRMIDNIEYEARKLSREDLESKLRLLEDRLMEFELACGVDIDDILERDIPIIYEKPPSLASTLTIADIRRKIEERLKRD